LLRGFAHPAKAADSRIDVAFRVGPMTKAVRVFGDRRWRRGVSDLGPSSPEPFDRIPLVYERAFGGRLSEMKWENAGAEEYGGPPASAVVA